METDLVVNSAIDPFVGCLWDGTYCQDHATFGCDFGMYLPVALYKCFPDQQSLGALSLQIPKVQFLNDESDE